MHLISPRISCGILTGHDFQRTICVFGVFIYVCPTAVHVLSLYYLRVHSRTRGVKTTALQRFVFRASRRLCMRLHCTRHIARTWREQRNRQQLRLISGLWSTSRVEIPPAVCGRTRVGNSWKNPVCTLFQRLSSCTHCPFIGLRVHYAVYSRRIVTSLYFSLSFTRHLATFSVWTEGCTHSVERVSMKLGRSGYTLGIFNVESSVKSKCFPNPFLLNTSGL